MPHRKVHATRRRKNPLVLVTTLRHRVTDRLSPPAHVHRQQPGSRQTTRSIVSISKTVTHSSSPAALPWTVHRSRHGPISFIHRIQAKLELFRLEKRYTQRRHRRSAFVSNAVYVDGEYIYQTPNSTGSYTDFNGNHIDALHGEKAVAVSAAKHTAIMAATPASTAIPASDSKRVHRFGEMPGIGDSFGSFGKDEQHVAEPRVRVTR
ncbi:hypothetical protein RJ55_08269 [Drechmeria coniospora]|nr:hypothetical protein RJ55_08269 [Drechmeria coniospora]